MTSVLHGTDKDWELWGKNDPYFGVLSQTQYLNSQITDQALAGFFRSGEQHVEHVFRTIRTRIQSDFAPQSILDYGCGTARLLIPFRKRASSVVGVDISPSMLQEAGKNCRKFHADDVRLLHADKFWSLPPSSFDFVHSYIVLQHIAHTRGMCIMAKMIDLLAEDGIGMIHVLFSDHRPLEHHLAMQLRKSSVLANGLLNLARGYGFARPGMQMNCYSLTKIFNLLMNMKCSHLYTEFSDHGGCRGALLYFKKSFEVIP